MVPVMSLWLPIVLSAVFVFVASSIIHMMLTYHNNDFRKVPNEADLQEALRKFSLPPGDYLLPKPAGSAGMKDPGYQEMVKKGPVVLMTVFPSGGFNMGASLAMWFVYCLVVSVFAAYVTGRAIGPGAPYLSAFRFAGVTAFAGYALALWQNAIWYKRSTGTTVRNTIDGLVYALVTAGAFGWLWPR
jgi:hypothetical protein